jgi:DNA-binding HxlR family transcriptional regulator
MIVWTFLTRSLPSCGGGGDNVEHQTSADLRLPGGGVSEDDQREIQAPDRLGSAAWPKRYGEIRTGLLRGADGSGEIAPRVLSRELKALAATGLIDRKDFGVVPPKVEYRLTRKGRSFIPVIATIRAWGTRHLTELGSGEKLEAAAE